MIIIGNYSVSVIMKPGRNEIATYVHMVLTYMRNVDVIYLLH